MDLYPIALLLHIIGALGAFVTLGFGWLGVSRLRSAATRPEAMTWLRVLGIPRRLGPASMLLILVPGVGMAATRWATAGWTAVGLVSLVGLALLGAVGTGRTVRSIAILIGGDADVLAPAVRERLARPKLLVSLWSQAGLALGVVAVMVLKPDLVASGATVTVCSAAGALVGWQASARGPEPVPGRLGAAGPS